MKLNNIFKLIIAIVMTELAGIIGAVFTTPAIPGWYASLVKPELAPPNWVFGPVWTTLYLLMGLSFYLVWRKNFQQQNALMAKERQPWNSWSHELWFGKWQKFNVLAIFAAQLLLNVYWSFVFFALHNPGGALTVILMLWAAILFTIMNFYRVSKLSAYLLIPYLLWVSFAVYLNFSIWQLN